MAKEWDEKTFRNWLHLRDTFKRSKKSKDWQNVICTCNKIIQLANQANFICIMTPLFYKELANAYEKTGDIDNSLKYYYLAKEDFIRYRNNNTLSKPTDWLVEIQRIDRRINKLSQNKTSK